MKELSLRPYTGRLFFCRSKEDYERSHKRIFATPDVLTCNHGGRFCGGEGKDGLWTYLIFAAEPHYLAHELSHVVLHVFERAGIDPIAGNGEPFCYMLSQLMIDAKPKEAA
jgi:hypothetical protein